MSFNGRELNVVEISATGDNVTIKDGVTPQDRIDMAEMGKKQQFNVRSVLCDSCASNWPVLTIFRETSVLSRCSVNSLSILDD
jgi:hypothetical protein